MNQGKDTSEWRKLLTQWLLKAELEVLDSFEKLWPKEAIRTKDYVFIPGTAES